MTIITINIKQFSDTDPKHLCAPTDTAYKKSSKYMGYITNRLRTILETEGYKLQLIESGYTTTILYLKEKKYRKITNQLSINNSIAIITIQCHTREEIINIEGTLKFLKIPKRAITII